MKDDIPHKGWSVGDAVTVKTAVSGYGSAYGFMADGSRCPAYEFKPGQIGKIGAVKVPKVTIHPPNKYPYFICIDWQCPETGKTERCAVNYDNIVRVK